MLSSQRVLVLTCFIATIALAGCGSPAASQPGTRQDASLPSAVLAPSAAPPATVSAVPARSDLATTLPTTVPTAPLLPSATDLPTSAPIASFAPTPEATVRPMLSESNTKLTIPVPDGVTLLDFAISPDGQYVVYVAGSRSSYRSWERAAIYSVPLHGGVPVQLSALDWQARDETNYYSAPYDQYVITPDSHAVIFQDADALYRVPIMGGAPQQLGDGLGAAGLAGPETGDMRTSFHNEVPDFRLYGACECIIYRTKTALSVLRLDGVPTMTVTDTPGGDSYIYGYTVSADGRWLLYDARKYDQWDEPKTPSWGPALIKIVAVYSVPLSGGAPLLLASGPTDDGAIKDYAISQEGTELFYTTYDDDGEGAEQGHRQWRVPLTGGTSRLRKADL